MYLDIYVAPLDVRFIQFTKGNHLRLLDIVDTVSCPGDKKLQIEVVYSKHLMENYLLKRKQMRENNGPSYINERFLVHGTSQTSARSIARHGFNRSFTGLNGKHGLIANFLNRNSKFLKCYPEAKCRTPAYSCFSAMTILALTPVASLEGVGDAGVT